MKSHTLKNTLILIFCTLLLTVGVVFMGFMPSKKASAESVPFCGYYEQSENKGVLDYGSIIQGTVTQATIVEASLNVPVANVAVNGSKITVSNLGDLDYEFQYTLKVVTTQASYLLGFENVTKAISKAEDVKILDISEKETVITGYYVLTNDIDLGMSMENAHQGIFISDSYNYNGFAGVFDGKGYNITFMAGPAGFFGRLRGNAIIRNVGFTDITFFSYGSGTFKYQGMPVIARDACIVSETTATISNVYIHSEDGTIPGGTILREGRTAQRLITENIIIRLGKPSSINTNTEGLALGAFIAWETGCWYLDRDSVTSQVYVLSSHVLGVYCDPNYKPESGRRWNDYGVTDENPGGYYTSKVNGWVRTLAGNIGVEQNLPIGQKVYRNIKQYVSYDKMVADDTNSYSGFNNEYWDLTTYGAPVWKRENNIEPEVVISNAPDKAITGVDFATIKPGDTIELSLAMLGIPITGGEWSYEFIEQADGKVYSLDAVSVSDTFAVTAIKEGDSRIKFTVLYDGKTIEKEFKFYVEHVHTFASEWSQNEYYHWHAATCGHTSSKSDNAFHTLENFECTVCGYHKHEYENVWTNNETHHWKKAICGCTDVVGSYAEHSIGADGNCECGIHVHQYSKVWTTTETEHWRLSICCNQELQIDRGAHVLDATGNCVCGRHEHRYASEWSSNASFHWRESICGHAGTEQEGHNFDGDICTVCAFEKQSHKHTFADEWTYDQTYHWHKPTCDDTTEVKDKASHSINATGTCECGYHAHQFSSDWTYDEVFHWHVATCGDTEDVKDKAGHDFSTQDTCVCGFVKPVVDTSPDHEHIFSETWTYDKTYHWHAAVCEHKSEISGKAQHSLDTTGTCECDYHEHRFATEWSSDISFHWHASICGHTEEISGKAGHNFNQENICEDCGYEIIVHVHTYSEAWSRDKNYHWHMATCGHVSEVSDRAEHSYDKDGNCICGLHMHIYSDKWSTNEYYHWHKATCVHNLEAKDVEVHDYTNGVCTVCGYTKDAGNGGNGGQGGTEGDNDGQPVNPNPNPNPGDGDGNQGGNGGNSGSVTPPPATSSSSGCGGGSASASGGTAGAIGGALGFGAILFMVIRTFKRRKNNQIV